jgi:predicted esterase YcpF (UPF0227 family)
MAAGSDAHPGAGCGILLPRLAGFTEGSDCADFEGLRAGRSDTLVGSSLGGCYATHLAEQLGCRAVLLNPSTRPAASLSKYLGAQTQYHDPTTTFVLEPHHLEELANLQTQRITRPERYFLIAATGDEVLDWREMVAFYQGARHHVIQGSDHGLSDFADYADEVLRFAGYLPA